MRKEFNWEQSTTTASRLFRWTSFKLSSSLWSLAKFTNTYKENDKDINLHWIKNKKSAVSRLGTMTYLVQGGLGDGVVLYAERLLVDRQQGEDAGERGERRGQLVLQHVTVSLL